MESKILYYLDGLTKELSSVLIEKVNYAVEKAVLESQSGCPNFKQPLLTIEEVATTFKISKSHINKLRRNFSSFPVINIDGCVRYDPIELLSFFKNLEK